MDTIKALLVILMSSVLVNNYVLNKFLGICPFLGVSKKLDSSIGMGAAFTFVMVCASLVTYPIYYGLLRLKASITLISPSFAASLRILFR